MYNKLASLNLSTLKKIDFRLIKLSKQLKGHSVISEHRVAKLLYTYLPTLFLRDMIEDEFMYVIFVVSNRKLQQKYQTMIGTISAYGHFLSVGQY